MKWTLYLYKNKQDTDCFLSPPSSECSEKSYIPRIGESIHYVDDNEDKDETVIAYNAQIIAISHDYQTDNVDIHGLITEEYEVT